MTGGIYSNERCPDCGSKFRDNHRDGLTCPNHLDRYARKLRVRFKDINRNFKSYPAASRFLTRARAEVDAHEFDERDYATKTKPLAFDRLAAEWLDDKKQEVKYSTYMNYQRYMDRATEFFQDQNVKTITGRDIRTFLYDQSDLSDKTRHEVCAALKQFWAWLRDYDELRPILERMPRFPVIRYELGTRTITDKETQLKVLAEVRRLEADRPRAWIAIQWLTRYLQLRPDDIRRIREKDVDLGSGLVTIERPTKRRTRASIWLIQEDLDLVRGLSRGLPNAFLFRHEVVKTNSVKAGQPFGSPFLYRIWKQACMKLGLEGVSLYAGTRHTSTTALQAHLSPDEIKRHGTGHGTNRAFERYLHPDRSKALDVATLAAGGQVVSLADEKEKKNESALD